MQFKLVGCHLSLTQRADLLSSHPNCTMATPLTTSFTFFWVFYDCDKKLCRGKKVPLKAINLFHVKTPQMYGDKSRRRIVLLLSQRAFYATSHDVLCMSLFVVFKPFSTCDVVRYSKVCTNS